MELTKELLEKILTEYVSCKYCDLNGTIECQTLSGNCFQLDTETLPEIMQKIEKEGKNGKIHS